MRLLLRPLKYFQINGFKEKFCKFSCIRVLSQQHVTISNQESLTGRIINYLNINNKQWDNEELLRNLYKNKHDNKDILKDLGPVKGRKVPQNVLSILKELDKEYFKRLHKLDKSELFALLNVYMSLLPNHVTQFKFYKDLIEALFSWLHRLDKTELVQLIFYIGLQKKTPEAQNMLRECMRTMNSQVIDNLTPEELCIICNSTFKSSTKIINKYLLNKIEGFINNNLSLLNDPQLFVTIVKTLRHNRCQNDDLMNTISDTIFFNKTFTLYNFAMICHILALYADYFFYDEKLLKFLTKKGLEQLKDDVFVAITVRNLAQIRGKDLKRFLWILSMFSEMRLVDQSDIKNVIMPKLMEHIKAGEFQYDFDSLLEIVLYLWMLNYRAYEIVPYIIKNKSKLLLVDNSPRSLNRNLLLYTISVEDPNFLQKIPVKRVSISSSDYSSYQLRKRAQLQRVLSCLSSIKKTLTIEKFEFSQEIPHINVVGITGFKSHNCKTVYIEMIDDYNRIRNLNEDISVGLTALKLRLLNRLDEGVLVLSQREVEEMGDSELTEYLLDELRLIC